MSVMGTMGDGGGCSTGPGARHRRRLALGSLFLVHRAPCSIPRQTGEEDNKH